MNKVKIKGEGFDDFDIEFIEPLYEERQRLTTLIHRVRTPEFTDKKGFLFYCYDIAKAITGMSGKELNVYNDIKITAISVEAINYLAKKK